MLRVEKVNLNRIATHIFVQISLKITSTIPLLTGANSLKKFFTRSESARRSTEFPNTLHPGRHHFPKNFFNALKETYMRLLLTAAAHQHEEIKTQLIRGIQYCNEELNLEITIDNPKELNALREYTYVEMRDGDVKLVPERRDGVERQGPQPGTVLENQIPAADRIIIPSVQTLTNNTLQYAVHHGTTISILKPGVTIHGEGTAGIEVIHSLDTETTLNEKYRGGRPPIGCEVSNGQLVKGENYQRVRQVLQDVISGEISKSKAGERLGCARQTVTNATQRRDLYSLD